MALQLRRGTDAERSAVTFADGELVYTTDTKKLYVGDGATAGGNSITALTTTLDGDLTGSVFGDDSTLIVDGNNNSINTSSIIATSNNVITVTGPITSSDVSFLVTGSGTNPGEIHLGRNGTGDLSADTIPNGRLTFNRTDTVNAGTITTSFIIGNNDRLSFFHNSAGNASNLPSYVVMKDSKFGIGTITPTTTLDVAGEGRFTGFVQFGSLTTVQRDALTAANGMVIYNSTDNKFQGYENGAWVNLI